MRPLHPDLVRLTFKTIPTENKFFAHLVFPLSLIDKKTARVKNIPAKNYSLTTVSDWRVFTDIDAPLIVRIATRSSVANTKEDFERIFFHPSFNPKADVIVSDPAIPTLSGNGSVEMNIYSPNFIQATTKTKGITMLVIADTYYKGWNAYIDKNPAPLYRVNWTMNGILLPEGDHTIDFLYEPISFTIGLWASALSLGLLVGIVVFTHQKRKQ